LVGCTSESCKRALTLDVDGCRATDKEAVLKKAEEAAAASKEETAKYYIKVMQKSAADTEFVTKESTRLKRMNEDGSVKPSKKEQFGRRLNVLSSF